MFTLIIIRNICLLIVWITSTLGPNTSCQKYLKQFLGAIESYLHPANSGKWVSAISEIIVQLPKFFFDRLIRERYKKHPWKMPVPGKCHYIFLN